MNQFYHLTRSSEIQRVRRLGKSNAHPLIVLMVYKIDAAKPTRLAIIAGKAVGGAVQRNRAKRRLRAVFQELFYKIPSGFDLVVIARKSILNASYQEIQSAIREVCEKARLVLADDVRN
jgi:ribonuclease P protein component